MRLAVADAVVIEEVLAVEAARRRGHQAGETIRYISSSFLLAQELVKVGREAGMMPYRALTTASSSAETSLWLYSLA